MRYVEPFVGGGAVFFGLKGEKPFLRWVGGKRKLFGEVAERLLPHRDGCHMSQFLYKCLPDWATCECHHLSQSLIADVNPDLVAAYQAVRDDVEQVVAWLREHPASAETHRSVRDMLYPSSRGARMIWLNTFSHGGLWRVNAKGLFNTPPQPDRFDMNLSDVAGHLRVASTLLQGVDVRCQDFSATLSQCGHDDVVYCDPPYLPDDTSSFVAYTRRQEETPLQMHQRLAFDVLGAALRGARVVVSNSPAAADVYCGVLNEAVGVRCAIDTISSQRSIGVGKSKTAKRRQDEILVTVTRR